MDLDDTDIVVKVPFSSFGGYFFLVLSEEAWHELVESYQDCQEYELEDDEGEILVIDLYASIIGAEVIPIDHDETLEVFRSLHDNKMYEILCNEVSDGGWERTFFLSSKEVIDTIYRYAGSSYELITDGIGRNRLIVPFQNNAGDVLEIVQYVDDNYPGKSGENEGAVVYTMNLAGEQAEAINNDFVDALEEFLDRVMSRLQQNDADEAPVFQDSLDGIKDKDDSMTRVLQNLQKLKKREEK